MDTKEGTTWLLVMQSRNFIVLIGNKTSSEIHESTNAFCVSLPFVAHRIIPMKKLLDFVILLLTTTTVTAYIKRAPLSPLKLARPERFELPTCWFVASHSIQLSYGRDLKISDLSPISC